MYAYLLISAEWMEAWRNFVKKLGPKPGKIRNGDLLREIEANRRINDYPEFDDNIGVKDKEDYYSLSVDFFSFFYDCFGCDHIIIILYQMV
jgi:hypothetical protein